MKARLLDLSIGLDGNQRILVELDGDFRKVWDNLHDKDCEITVKRYRQKRSLDANALAWVLIGKIAEAKHITKTEVYRNAIREIGGVSEMLSMRKSAVKRFQEQWNRNGVGWQVEDIGGKTPGWTNVIVYYGSSAYDTKQMSALIDALIQDAQSMGIETDERIYSLLEEHDAKFSNDPRQID